MSETVVRFRFGDGADTSVALPAYASDGAAGLDVRANFLVALRGAGLQLKPGESALVPTGLEVAIPEDFEIQVRPRSGLALRHGVTLLNSPGTIDSDYRGQIGVILVNHGKEPFHVRHGERVAQLVLARVAKLVWQQVETLPGSQRGEGGFGSTGL